MLFNNFFYSWIATRVNFHQFTARLAKEISLVNFLFIHIEV